MNNGIDSLWKSLIKKPLNNKLIQVNFIRKKESKRLLINKMTNRFTNNTKKNKNNNKKFNKNWLKKFKKIKNRRKKKIKKTKRKYSMYRINRILS